MGASSSSGGQHHPAAAVGHHAAHSAGSRAEPGTHIHHHHHDQRLRCANGTVVAFALVDTPLPHSHMFWRTATHHGYDVRVVRMGNYTTYNAAAPRGVNNFVSIRVAASLEFLRSSVCDDDVVMLLDAYDIFFLEPATTALQRFHAASARVVWSVERMYSAQDPDDKRFYDDERKRLGVDRGNPYGYINSGGIIGYASTLRELVSDALTIRIGASGWRNKTCGEAIGRRCADQWIYGKLLAGTGGDGMRRFNVSLDYNRSLFYVPTGSDWSYSVATRRISADKPCVLHMPFIQAPKVNATLQALYQGLFLGNPPPEANFSVCMQRANWCRDASWGLKDMMEQLDRHTSPRHRAPPAPPAPEPSSQALREVLHTPARKALYNAACYNESWAPKTRGYCQFARDLLEPPFWRDLSFLWASRNGTFSFVGTSRWHHLSRVPFLQALDKYLWHRAPYCFPPPSGVRTTWVIC